METPPDPHYRHLSPAEIISHSVWLYHVFSLSFLDWNSSWRHAAARVSRTVCVGTVPACLHAPKRRRSSSPPSPANLSASFAQSGSKWSRERAPRNQAARTPVKRSSDKMERYNGASIIDRGNPPTK